MLSLWGFSPNIEHGARDRVCFKILEKKQYLFNTLYIVIGSDKEHGCFTALSGNYEPTDRQTDRRA